VRIAADNEWASYFEETAKYNSRHQQIANWMLGPIRSYLNEHEVTIHALLFTPKVLALLIDLLEEGSVSHTVAVQKLFPRLLKEEVDPRTLAVSLNLIQERNTDTLSVLVDNVLSKMPEKVQEYKKGKKGLMGLFVGEVMKQSKGKADPKLLNQLIAEKLQA
jgi:aspartyl-tRNA(Asn)/glutamyl-tRNA(Gln) amidotransferase subunit B